MILSQKDIFSENQAVTGTVVSDNIKDLGSQTPDYGGGTFAPFIISQVATTFTGTGNLRVQFLNSDFEDLGLPDIIYTSPTFDAAALTTGVEISSPRIPSGRLKRYLGVRYVVAGADFTTGAVTTFLTLDRQMKRYYERGFDV